MFQENESIPDTTNNDSGEEMQEKEGEEIDEDKEKIANSLPDKKRLRARKHRVMAKPRCNRYTRKGYPCQRPALAGKEYCHAHDPEFINSQRERLKAIGKKSGKKSKERARKKREGDKDVEKPKKKKIEYQA